jgi:hypothetical protein
MMLARPALAALGIVAALAIVVPVHFTTTANAMVANQVKNPPPPPSSKPPDNPGNTGGDGGDLPQPPLEVRIRQMEETCNGALHQLAKVPEKLVDEFSNASGVTVVPFCNSGLGHSITVYADQALPLQNAIARNFALMTALAARGFKPEDVVGIVIADGVATLYVHKMAHA